MSDKKLWLRPGKKYLIGRTKGDSGGLAIEHKSISRKHLTIEVAAVQPGSAADPSSRSQLTVEDQESKFGTLLDGEQIRGQSRVFQDVEHRLKLGSVTQLLRLRYQPTVLTYSFSSKERKAGDPLTPVRAQLEPLDVKAVHDYVPGHTSHVIAGKRNTAKGLQALLSGAYIVTNAFVENVISSATPSEPSDSQSLAPLEQDFDTYWPDALQYLPTQSREPTQRADSFFAPDTSRTQMLSGYTVIFCERGQFDTLQAVVTAGGGKPVLFNVRLRETRAEALVKFVKDAAGENGLGPLETAEDRPGVVVVRFRGRGEDEKWSIELGNEASRTLDQRFVEQSEFLDAILMNDAKSLRRRLPETAEPDIGMTSQSQSNGDARQSASKESEDSVSHARRRGASRRPVVSRFTGFDDGFDASSLPPRKRVRESSDEDAGRQKRRKSVPGSDEDISPPQIRKNGASQSKGKNNRNALQEDVTMSDMFPAAAEMRRRQTQTEEPSKPTSRPTKSQKQNQSQIQDKTSKTRRAKKKDLDILGSIRISDNATQNESDVEEEDIQAVIDGMSVADMQRLALVEDVPLRTSTQPSSDLSTWDERWNGRKNFKKFRRARDGQAAGPRRRGTGIIVGLEEVSKKKFGMGDEYWEAREPQQGSAEIGVEESESVRRGSKRSRQETRKTPSSAAEKRTSSRVKERDSLFIGSQESMDSSQDPTPQPSRRPVPEIPEEDEDEDEDEEDELKFRFKRTKR